MEPLVTLGRLMVQNGLRIASDQAKKTKQEAVTEEQKEKAGKRTRSVRMVKLTVWVGVVIFVGYCSLMMLGL